MSHIAVALPHNFNSHHLNFIFTMNSSPNCANTHDQLDSNWTKSSASTTKENSFKFPSNSLNISQCYYAMKPNQTKGRCVILNYEKFIIFDKPRKGSKHDVKALKKTFSALNFQIVEYHNLTVQQTKNVIRFESSYDHSHFDCFILCILSHGESDFIYCNDDSLSISYLFDSFTPLKCPSLASKPKVFLIQACRGDLFDSGTIVHDSSEKLGFGHFLLPTAVDFLIFYSTYPGFVSWRNKDTGSWFIQDICEALQKYSPHVDLLTICSIVTQSIAYNRFSQGQMKNKKQMPCLMTTLTKLMRF